MAPKVEGAWNLHEALKGRTLDFFILFSSISCIMGQRGQGNYGAANTFLDSFVQYRQNLGLPASVIDVGVMEDVGYVSQNPAVLEHFKASGMHTLREQDLMDTLQLLMTQYKVSPPSTAGYRNSAQVVIGLRSTKPLSDPSNRTVWKRDIRMSHYRNQEAVAVSSSGVNNEDFKKFLAAVAKQPSLLDEQSHVDFLTHKIGLHLGSFMLQSEDIDVKQSLTALGVDSLVAIEIRNWCRQNLGLDISVLEIMNSGSIEQLGKTAAEKIQQKHGIVSKEEKDT